MFIIGRIADKANSVKGLIEISGIHDLVKGEQAFKEAVAQNYGGLPNDYDIFQVTSQTQKDRIMAQDEFEIVWGGDSISSLDFSIEDDKRKIEFTIDKDELQSDNVDRVIVKATVYEADGVTVDLAYKGKINIAITEVDQPSSRVFRFRKGYASISIKTNKVGSWKIPSVSKLIDRDDEKLVVVTPVSFVSY